MSGDARRGDQLVHYAAVYADPLVLRALGDARDRGRGPGHAVQGREHARGRELEGGARRQPSPDGYVTGDTTFPAVFERRAGGGERPRDAANVLEPPAVWPAARPV